MRWLQFNRQFRRLVIFVYDYGPLGWQTAIEDWLFPDDAMISFTDNEQEPNE